MQTLPNTNGTPPAEVDVDEELVRKLLEIGHPDLSGLPIRKCDSGWDNFIFRLGDALAIRLPRRAAAVNLVLNEQKWLPVFAHRLPVPIPRPIRCGTPGAGFPWPWSIVPWIDGTTSDLVSLSSNQTHIWAAFLQALHQPAPDAAPANPFRGVPLRDREEAFEQRFARLSAIQDLLPAELRDIWDAALSAPESHERVWLHGDLHGRNVLNVEGSLSGVIDWGDLTSGDPATDLASVWTLFNSKADRAIVLDAYGGEMAARARGWAALFALAHLEAGLADNPAHKLIGERILSNLVN
jgi:aminoglycoside phosphotransferase (APT) family kinase protein